MLLAAAWVVGYGSSRFSHEVDRASVVVPEPLELTREVSWSARYHRALELPGGLARRLALLQGQDQASDQGARELLESGKLDWSERLNVLRAWAQRDPAGCWVWQRQQPDYIVGWTVIAPEWAQRDMKAVMTALQTMPFTQKIHAQEILLRLWLSGDATLSRQIEPYLDSLADLRGSRLSSYNIPKEGRDTLVERLLALPQGRARSTLVRDYAAVLFQEDWQKGLTFTQRFPGPEREALLEQLATTAFSQHSKPNSEAEAWGRQWLEEEATPVARTRVAMAYLRHLAARDPAAALAWASQWLEGQP